MKSVLDNNSWRLETGEKMSIKFKKIKRNYPKFKFRERILKMCEDSRSDPKDTAELLTKAPVKLCEK